MVAKRSTIVWIAATVLGVLSLTWWLLSRGTRGAEVATVAAIPLTVFIALTTIWFSRKQHSGSAVIGDAALAGEARKLAGKVYENETSALNNLIADTGYPEPAELTFAQLRYPQARTDGGADEGSLSSIQSYFGQLRRGRLVVTGAAGGGKTVLAIQITRTLAANAANAANAVDGFVDQRGQRSPIVPARIIASSIDLGVDRAPTGQGKDSAERFDTFLARHLVSVYGVEKEVATRLMADGWILPVVDGLDEMDQSWSWVPPLFKFLGPTRMSMHMLLQAINYATPRGLRPIVLTCRARRYMLQAENAQRGGRFEIAQDATVIELRRLSGSAVRDFLARRFADSARPGRVERRWKPIISRINADLPGDPLVAALQSPLRLYLAIAAYRSVESDPAELTKFEGVAELDDHLFAGLIPAVIQASRTFYSPQVVTRWLVTLSGIARRVRVNSLSDESEPTKFPVGARPYVAQSSGTGILLSDLWLICADAARRRGATLAAIPFGVILFAHMLVVLLPVRPGVETPGFWNAVVTSASVAIALALVLRWVAVRREPTLYTVNLGDVLTALRLQKVPPPGDDTRWSGLAAAVGGGLTAWLLSFLPFLPMPDLNSLDGVVAIIVAMSCTMIIVLVCGPTDRPVRIKKPSDIAVQGLYYTCRPIVVGALVGIGSTTLWLNGRWNDRLSFVLLFLAIGAWVAGLRWWPRYFAAALLLSRAGDLPHRPTRFLDWACEWGLMRVEGGALQFRHLEFQEWLSRQQSGIEPVDHRLPVSLRREFARYAVIVAIGGTIGVALSYIIGLL